MEDSVSVNAAIEHSIVVPRTARYFTLGAEHGFPRELWFVCHGHGQLAGRFINRFAPLDDGTRLVVAPEAHSRYYLDPIAERIGQKSPRIGATWMTKEFREAEITDYVAYLDQMASEIRARISGASPRIVVLGFSQALPPFADGLRSHRYAPISSYYGEGRCHRSSICRASMKT